MDLEEDMKFEEPFYDIKSPKPTDLPNDRYTILKNLVEGESNYSFVYSCTDTNNGKIKALKFIKLTEKLIDRIKNEITIMRILHHPNIIQMERYFRTGPYVCVVLPYSPHRSLAWILTQYYRDGMDEEIAVDMMKQMLKAVQYLHLNNICHRDIKPDNFLIFDDPNNSYSDYDDTDSDYIYSPIVVLTDFGFAKHFNPKELFKDYLGTYDYLAPEIVEDKPYDCSVDIWALGIVLFKMLAGDLPFTSFHLSPKACYSHITTGNFNYDMLKHKNVSHEAIDLIQKMCNIDPKKRIKAELALKHPWILKSEKPQIIQDITAFMGSPEEYVNSAPGT